MIHLLIIFSQLFLSGGIHGKITSVLYFEADNICGAGANIFARTQDSNFIPELSLSYLWNETQNLRGWEFSGIMWRVEKGRLNSGFYPGFGINFLNYRYKEDDWDEKVTMLAINLSGLLNIKLNKYGIGIKGSVNFPFFFFIILFANQFEITFEFYRLPE